jgi:hypothetical protein
VTKLIDQLVDRHDHLIEFIWPCHDGQTLVRWFTNPTTFNTQQLLPPDNADWVKQGLLKDGYHVT